MKVSRALQRKAKLIAGQFLGSAVTLYFIFYALPFPIDYLPKTDKVVDKYFEKSVHFWDRLLSPLALKILKHLHKDIPYESVGVGDSLGAYLHCFALAGLAMAVAAIICATARRGRIADWLKQWGGLYLRCFLSFQMLWYAAIKSVRQQFPFPGLERFLTPFGGSSPIGLLWTFMGYSRGYSTLAGIVELLGAVLLLFRRTTAGGALLLIIVLSNVGAVDVFFDVQMKLIVFHLLALAIYFLAPTLNRLADVLLFARDSQAPLRCVSPQTRRREWIITGAIVLCAALVFGNSIRGARAFVARRGFQKPVPPWFGIYEVGEVARDGVSVNAADPLHWTSLIVDRGPGDSDLLAVRNSNSGSTWTHYQLRLQPDGSFAVSTEQGPVGRLAFTGAADEFVEAHGEFLNSQLVVELRRADPEKFPLLNGKIHWVHKPAP